MERKRREKRPSIFCTIQEPDQQDELWTPADSYDEIKQESDPLLQGQFKYVDPLVLESYEEQGLGQEEMPVTVQPFSLYQSCLLTIQEDVEEGTYHPLVMQLDDVRV